MKKLLFALTIMLFSNISNAQRELEAIHVSQGLWINDHFEYNDGVSGRIDILFTDKSVTIGGDLYKFTSELRHSSRESSIDRTSCQATDNKGNRCMFSWVIESGSLPILNITYEDVKIFRYQLMMNAEFPLKYR
jgi:hypothetical protein